MAFAPSMLLGQRTMLPSRSAFKPASQKRTAVCALQRPDAPANR